MNNSVMTGIDNSLTDTEGKIISLPTIEIPKDLQPDEDGKLKFQIETTKGSIEVTYSWHSFHAKGTAGALAAYGLLQTDWLPGLPGNSKISQNVVFEEGRAVLFKMRNQHAPESRITITRLSKALATYEVRVPASKDQEEFIEALREQCQEEREKEESARIAALYPMTAERVRDFCLSFIDTDALIIPSRMKEHGFCYTEESMARINRAFDELHNAIAEGVIIQMKDVLRRDGNVIYLGARSAGGNGHE